MTTSRAVARPHPRVIRTGLAGGAAKPSTGYAFGAIQHMSATLAGELSSGVSPAEVSTPRYRRRRSMFLDDVFLSYLSHHPGRAAELFRDIFRNCAGDRIARFLTDAGTPADDLAMIAAMPKIPFIAEALAFGNRLNDLTRRQVVVGDDRSGSGDQLARARRVIRRQVDRHEVRHLPFTFELPEFLQEDAGPVDVGEIQLPAGIPLAGAVGQVLTLQRLFEHRLAGPVPTLVDVEPVEGFGGTSLVPEWARIAHVGKHHPYSRFRTIG